MTKQLDCIVDGCHATIEGESEDEVMNKAAKHARKEHPNLELDDEKKSDIRSNIVDV